MFGVVVTSSLEGRQAWLREVEYMLNISFEPDEIGL